MGQEIKVKITIDGKEVTPFSSLMLSQQINGHHYFELRFNQEVIEDDGALLTASQNYLGSTIAISFGFLNLMEGADDEACGMFKGVVTEVEMTNGSASTPDLIFKGYSPTILLDSGEHCKSFVEKSVLDVVRQVVQEGAPGNLLEFQLQVSNSYQPCYTVQYCESTFDFVRRIAAESGEWFFYNGTKLYFGKPGSPKEVSLRYPHEITDLRLAVKLMPIQFRLNANNFKDKDDIYESEANSQSVAFDSLGDKAFRKSKSTFTQNTNTPAFKNIKDKGALDHFTKAQKGSTAAQLVCLQATCDSPEIIVGCEVDITAINELTGKETNYGKYIVINVTHSLDGSGNYENSFEAIPATVDILPNEIEDRDYIEPQVAVVTQNGNDKNQVKVKMIWDESVETPWIPVMQPNVGDNGKKKNRGFMFTPEVGDYVLVSFTENDPSRPFVMGSIPLDEAMEAPMSDNDEKLIRTRSGNTIYFRDKSGEEEVRIETKDDQNFISIKLSSSDGMIEINSTKSILIKSEGIVLDATKDIEFKAQGSIKMTATKDIIMTATGKLEAKGTQGVELTASGGDLKGHGLNVSLNADIGATVKGNATAEISASGQTVVKGAIVMIN